jgi:hypothetical protein
VDFAESQDEVAAAWRQRANECADDNDIEGWRAAREQARRATVSDPLTVSGSCAASRRRSHPRRGSDVGVARHVALARRESPSQGDRHLTAALALVRYLPRTFAALETGALSEWRAEIVMTETAVLTADQRTAAEAELLEGLGAEGVGELGTESCSGGCG